MEKFKILVVDDEKNYRKVLTTILEANDYTVEDAKNADVAMEKIVNNNYDLILTDLVMKEVNGLELLKQIKEYDDSIDVILVTGYGSIESAVNAMKKGAFSYYIKSKSPKELLLEIEKLINKRNSEIKFDRINYSNISVMLETKNDKFAKVLKIAEKASKSNINVLILGESGVGKEVIAKYIYNMSKRSDFEFVPVNCHAYSINLLESELFGHEKGSFTGATSKKIGKFELADKGIIFLDEIGELSNDMQVKLLRVLEEREIERVGGIERIKVDFRLISATNAELLQDKNNEFREDLYYRISTIILRVPPLRERKVDLPKLIDFFIMKMSEELKIDVKKMEKSVYNYLLEYDYPGNIRELKNIIERLVALSEDGIIDNSTLFIDEDEFNKETENKSLKEFRENAERKYIIKIIDKCSGNITEAAKVLNISRRQLYNKINSLKI